MFETVRGRVKQTVPPDLLSAACLYWARHGMCELTRRATARVMVQAGTCVWRYRTDDAAGPSGDTHYGYQWEFSPASIASVACGNLPEIHIWLAILYDDNPEAYELVDFSSGMFVEAAKKRGIVWELPPPPEYIWLRSSDPWPEAQYRPDVGACVWVNSILRKLRGEGPTQALLARCIREAATDYYQMAGTAGFHVQCEQSIHDCGLLTITSDRVAKQADYS